MLTVWTSSDSVDLFRLKEFITNNRFSNTIKGLGLEFNFYNVGNDFAFDTG